jgi:hypothetical protein
MQPASWNGPAPRLPSVQNARLAQKLAGAKVLQSRVRGRVRLAKSAAHEDELTRSPSNSLDGLLGNAVVSKQPGYRPGLPRITCGSMATSVWSRRQKWW